jgi:hypothetical protein
MTTHTKTCGCPDCHTARIRHVEGLELKIGELKTRLSKIAELPLPPHVSKATAIVDKAWALASGDSENQPHEHVWVSMTQCQECKICKGIEKRE